MADLEDVLKEASNTLIHNCFRLGGMVLSPVKSVANEAEAVLLDIETDTQMHRQRSLDRAQTYRTFLKFKGHYASSPDSDGKLVYYFLCSIEALPPAQREAMIFKAAAYIHSEPDLARTQIANAMRKQTQNNLLGSLDQSFLLGE